MTSPATPTMPALAASSSPIAAAATTASDGDAGQGKRDFLRVLAEQRQNAEATSPAPAEADAASVARAEISDDPAPDTANDTTDQCVSTPRVAESAKQPNATRHEPGEREDDGAALATGLAAVTLDIAAQVAELQARRSPGTPTTTPVRAQTQSISPTALDQRADTLAVGSERRGDFTLAGAEATEPTALGRAGALSATTQRFGLANPLGLRWSAQGSGNRPMVRAGVGAATQSSAQLLAQLSASVAAHSAGATNRDDALGATALARGTYLTEPLPPPHLGDAGDVGGAAFGDLLTHDSHGAPSDVRAATASLVLPDSTRANSEALRVAAPTLPAIAAPHWGQALGQRLLTLARQDGDRHHVELRLDPPELGPLRVTLSVTDGVAHAAFVSPHAQVRHSVEAALEQLQATLAQVDIALGQTHVGEHDAPEHDAFFTQHSSDNYASVRVESTRETSAPTVRSDALVDVYA